MGGGQRPPTSNVTRDDNINKTQQQYDVVSVKWNKGHFRAKFCEAGKDTFLAAYIMGDGCEM